MTLTELVKLAHDNAVRKGFWLANSFPTQIALVHTELSEALESDRTSTYGSPEWMATVSEELADVVIRIADMCGGYRIDLDAAVAAKMQKNAERPLLHGKRY